MRLAAPATRTFQISYPALLNGIVLSNLRRNSSLPDTASEASEHQPLSPDEAEAMDEDDTLPPGRGRGPDRSRSRGRGSEEALSSNVPAAWWTDVKEHHWPDQGSAFWQDKTSAVEIGIDLPASQRGRDKALRDLGTYFVGSLKRRAVELSERKMSPEEREAFGGAKAIEVKNFVASKAFEVLPEALRPDKSQAIGMRWILTWKLREDGTRKPKARAVLLGYQDEAYEHRATTSPVMSRQTRQMLLQLTAWKRWKVQSRQYPDTLYCIPCPEICAALGIPSDSVTKVKKACYGLVDAPLEWYRSVDTFLQSLGFTKLWSDPCCWVLRVHGVLRGAISGHVDDFLFCGKQGDPLSKGSQTPSHQRPFQVGGLGRRALHSVWCCC